MSAPRNHYEVLELNQTATLDDIKRQFRKLALKWHPDKNIDNKDEAEERFKEIDAAYKVLLDPQKRQEYDAKLAQQEADKQAADMRAKAAAREAEKARAHTAAPGFDFHPRKAPEPRWNSMPNQSHFSSPYFQNSPFRIFRPQPRRISPEALLTLLFVLAVQEQIRQQRAANFYLCSSLMQMHAALMFNVMIQPSVSSAHRIRVRQAF